MKILVFIIGIFFISFSFVKGQTVVIDCTSPSSGTNCFLVNPEEQNGYTDIVTNIPTGYSISSTSWEATPTGDRKDLLGESSSFFKLTWLNKNNATTKKVKVTIVFSNGTPSQNITKTDEKTVVVKYIGAITSMTLSGDVTANPANNSTLSIPCGVKLATISVPTPATDPNVGVTYTWSLPSGWNGSSTSNTISVETNAGQTNGTISVVTRRNDGIFTQSYAVKITRPVVGTATISGIPSTNLCYNSAIPISANATNAYIYNWSTTGAVTTGWAISNSVIILSGSTGSSGTITLSADNACQSPQSETRTIYVGPPAITSATVDWLPLAYPNYINNPGFLTINVNNAEGSSTNWTLLNGSGNIYYAGQNQVSVYSLPVYAG